MSFDSRLEQKEIQTSQLKIAYLESGPDDGRPVVLFHGFPDNATSFEAVMLRLNMLGYKTYAPYLRGYAPTTFLDSSILRTGDMAALGHDAVDFFDMLDLKEAIVVGQDWGSAVAEVLTFSRQDRIEKLVKLNWHGAYAMDEIMKEKKFDFKMLRKFWHIILLNTPAGKPLLKYARERFAKILWKDWSPCWDKVDLEKAFERAKSSFVSPDFAPVVLSSYRSGMGRGPLDPAHEQMRALIKRLPPITCETVVLYGSEDKAEGAPLSREAISKYFKGSFRSAAVEGSGHFIHRENPESVVEAITSSDKK